MAGLPRDRSVKIQWSKFKIVSEKKLNEEWDPWVRSVYVVGDTDWRPLYIGRAAASGNPGFGNRYYSSLNLLPALAYGTTKFWFVGQIAGKPRQKWYRELEGELIARESKATDGTHPRFNLRQYKGRDPDTSLHLRHVGDVPWFFHLHPPRRRRL